jgi:hypothetical protein
MQPELPPPPCSEGGNEQAIAKEPVVETSGAEATSAGTLRFAINGAAKRFDHLPAGGNRYRPLASTVRARAHAHGKEQLTIIVAEASNDRIVGSIFLTRTLRVSAPSPLPAYDTFDPPLIIRFLMEK